jgi:hypothetical protein
LVEPWVQADSARDFRVVGLERFARYTAKSVSVYLIVGQRRLSH